LEKKKHTKMKIIIQIIGGEGKKKRKKEKAYSSFM
jgi:hypothetical protein